MRRGGDELVDDSPRDLVELEKDNSSRHGENLP
jgi:hypothetical protein